MSQWPERFRGQIGVARHQPVDMPVDFSKQVGRKDIPHDDVTIRS